MSSPQNTSTTEQKMIKHSSFNESGKKTCIILNEVLPNVIGLVVLLFVYGRVIDMSKPELQKYLSGWFDYSSVCFDPVIFKGINFEGERLECVNFRKY